MGAGAAFAAERTDMIPDIAMPAARRLADASAPGRDRSNGTGYGRLINGDRGDTSTTPCGGVTSNSPAATPLLTHRRWTAAYTPTEDRLPPMVLPRPPATSPASVKNSTRP